jgi:acyl-CoA reductase-like NAD-dependent aldehyde dehydrogenase
MRRYARSSTCRSSTTDRPGHLNSPIPAPRSRYQEVVDAVAALAEGLTVGNPIDKATDIGPLVSSRRRERVLDYIEIGKSEGAKLVAGGSVPADQPCGWFVAPTVFADVDNPARISQEEIFGPVLTVTPYENDRDAVDIANDTEFRLGGSVWSTDVERATDTAHSVRTGTIGVNDYQMDIIAPFGGVKAGGIGRELGPEGLAAYQTLKSIYRVGPSD